MVVYKHLQIFIALMGHKQKTEVRYWEKKERESRCTAPGDNMLSLVITARWLTTSEGEMISVTL